jgi:DNA-binding NarL/FixJ family response regulator
MTVRILVADDHPVVRHGLKNLIGSRPEWEIVDEASDGVEALEKAHKLVPDVVVLDITMPRMDGLEVCRRIRKGIDAPEVLIVTQHDSPQMHQAAISAGAIGYVVKSNAVRDLLEAVQAVSEHKFFPVRSAS